MIPFIINVQNRQINRDNKQMSGCQGLGEGEEISRQSIENFEGSENTLYDIMMDAGTCAQSLSCV